MEIGLFVQQIMVNRILFCLLLAFCGQAVFGKVPGGGGIRLVRLVDAEQRPLSYGAGAVCVHAYLLDSTSRKVIRPLSIEVEPWVSPPELGQSPPLLFLSPNDAYGANGRSNVSCLRIIFASKADTMVLDLIDVPGPGLPVDELQRLEFRPGHMVCRRDPARADPKTWHHTRKKDQAHTRALLHSGLHSATLPELIARGLVEFTPAPARAQADAPVQALDTATGIHLVATVADVMVFRLHGRLMTDGACQAAVFVGLQYWDDGWQDIIGASNFSQMDCGPSSQWCAGEQKALRISTFKKDALGIHALLPAGRYRAVVLDGTVPWQAHFSEEFVYAGQQVLPTRGSYPYQVLSRSDVVVTPSSIDILAGNRPLRIAETDAYFFEEIQAVSSRSMDNFSLPAAFHGGLQWNEMVIRGQAFTGCFTMAWPDGNQSHTLHQHYYLKGRLVWRDVLKGFNWETGEQEGSR
jgi:hypothetical protein